MKITDFALPRFNTLTEAFVAILGPKLWGTLSTEGSKAM